MKRKTSDAARGKWSGILKTLGIEDGFLNGKHGPCPICGGVDRFRWDNKDGNGGFICGQCGSGNGFDLLMKVNGWNFQTAAARIDEICGNIEAQPNRPKMDERTRADMLNRLWLAGTKLQAGDPAFAYLTGRVALPKNIPSCLRFARLCPAPDKIERPAMLALVQKLDGSAANIHRTFLGPKGKAVMDNPRAMMPGEVPEGSAVRLFPVHGERLGIAEGIETAFAAAAKFGLPVWSALNSTMLAKWQPPAGVTDVAVFGDCDQKFGGQAAAYALAAKLAGRCGLSVQVHIPSEIGKDWADATATARI